MIPHKESVISVDIKPSIETILYILNAGINEYNKDIESANDTDLPRSINILYTNRMESPEKIENIMLIKIGESPNRKK